MKHGNYEFVHPPKGYPGKIYKGNYCYEHHLVWWKNTGHAIQGKENIHHKDGNPKNNDFSNLELTDKIHHIAIHRKKIGKDMVQFKCPMCSKIFVRYKRITRLAGTPTLLTFCSRSCIHRYGFKKKKRMGYDFSKDIQSNVLSEFHRYLP